MKTLTDIFELALREVISEVGFDGSRIEIDSSENETFEVMSSIGLTGDIRGYLILRTDYETAIRFSHAFAEQIGIGLEEEVPPAFGPFQKEAVCEIANQISGRAIMILSTEGFDCNITPPTVLTGENVSSNMINFDDFYAYRIIADFGKISILVGIKKAKI